MLKTVRVDEEREKESKRKKFFFKNRTKSSTKETKNEIRACYSEIFLWGENEFIVFDSLKQPKLTLEMKHKD